MSALDRLTIKGFKSIENLEGLTFKEGLNLFIGANGAGKTNLISFFRMMSSIMGDSLRDYIIGSGGVNDLLFNGPKATKEMYFEMHFADKSYTFTLKPTPGGECYIVEENIVSPNGRMTWRGNGHYNISAFVHEAKSSRESYEPIQLVYNAISSWQVYHFHDTSKTAGMRHYEIVQDSKFLRSDAANIAPFLYKLRGKHALEYKEILNAIRIVMPFFNEFQLDIREFGEAEKLNVAWHQKGTGYPMQPYHFSDGSIRFICLAAALLQPDPPSTIIIDEPELGLHPTAISILAELIQDAAKRAQVIVATQSPALIDHFAIDDIAVVNREAGASTFEHLEEKDFTVWLENYSLGELWSTNVISAGTVHE